MLWIAIKKRHHFHHRCTFLSFVRKSIKCANMYKHGWEKWSPLTRRSSSHGYSHWVLKYKMVDHQPPYEELPRIFSNLWLFKEMEKINLVIEKKDNHSSSPGMLPSAKDQADNGPVMLRTVTHTSFNELQLMEQCKLKKRQVSLQLIWNRRWILTLD